MHGKATTNVLILFNLCISHCEAPGSVKSLNVTASSNDSIEVNWQAPESQCEVTSYTVTHTLTLLDQCMPMNEYELITTVDTNIKIDDLESFSTYKVAVQANSSNERGPVEYVETATQEMGKFYNTGRF